MVSISEAKGKDMREILLLIKKEFPYLKTDLNLLRSRGKESSRVILKAEEEGEFAGFIEIELKDMTGWILGLGVKETLRRKSIGSLLVKDAIRYLETQGVSEIRLLVREENATARKIYLDLGFKSTGIPQQPIQWETIEELVLVLKHKGKPQYVS